MGNIWRNEAHLEKRVTLVKKWVTLGKRGHTWENGAHLEKRVRLEKMGHTGNNTNNG